MAKYVPEIQDRLRRQGFPRFLQGKIQQFRINAIAAGPNSPQPPNLDIVDLERWEFQNPQKSVGFVLVKDSIALHMSRYTSFEQFCASFEQGLNVVHEVASLALIERVGLRYVDLIVPAENQGFEDFFGERLLGPEKEPLDVEDSLYGMEFRGRTTTGTLAVKLSQNDTRMMLPPDLSPSTLSHQLPDLKAKQKVALLDIDHSIDLADKAKEFSTAAVSDLLWRLHHNTDLAFRYSVREEAINRWKSSAAPQQRQ